MPSKKQYDLVSDDGYDSRIPLHNEEAFQHGISFQAKYIGTLDVPRPSSRVEIVAAMRRIRYEFKAKAIKKKKVCITISTEGAKVSLRKKKKLRDWTIFSRPPATDIENDKNQWPWDENRLMVMNHPIYRIFYVSHDSQDLKIFSYIARDGTTNVFKCNVFKAYKKSTAMRIVRTIGQAFEVCHKLSMHFGPKPEPEAAVEENSKEEQERRTSKISPDSNYESEPAGGDDGSTNPAEEAFKQAQALLTQSTHGIKSPPESHCPPNIPPDTPTDTECEYEARYEPVGGTISSPLGSPHLVGDIMPANTTAPLSTHHQMQLLRQQLEQQQQQTQVSIAQVHLLKDQLAAETAARIEAQARTHQLLLQNRELLEHINNLVGRLQDLELKVNGVVPSADMLIKIPPQEEGATAEGYSTISRVYTNKHRRSKLLPYLEELKEVLRRLQQIPVLPDPTTPQSGPVIMPEYRDIEASNMTAIPEQTMFENSNIKTETTDSPDSGHKEMSSDSLSLNCNLQDNANVAKNQDVGPWHRMSNGHEFLLHKNPLDNNPFSMAPIPRASETRRESPRKDRFKVITPLPSQDASGNRLELNTITPRLDPPPKIKRERSSSRSPKNSADNGNDTNFRNSFHSTSSQESQSPFYRCKYPIQRSDSHPGDRVENHDAILRNHSNNTNVSTSSSSSSSSSRTINNLSQSPNNSNQFIMPQTDTLKAKLRISFSDDENGNTSTEDNSMTREQPRRPGSYLDDLVNVSS